MSAQSVHAWLRWSCGRCHDELIERRHLLDCPGCKAAFEPTDETHAAAVRGDAIAYRSWWCLRCLIELETYGSAGDLSCTSCGQVIRPDPDGHEATRPRESSARTTSCSGPPGDQRGCEGTTLAPSLLTGCGSHAAAMTSDDVRGTLAGARVRGS